MPRRSAGKTALPQFNIFTLLLVRKALEKIAESKGINWLPSLVQMLGATTFYDASTITSVNTFCSIIGSLFGRILASMVLGGLKMPQSSQEVLEKTKEELPITSGTLVPAKSSSVSKAEFAAHGTI